MALTAKFQADFSSFINAIDKAELALVDFGGAANTVEKKLNTMVDNFAGRKLTQEAILMANAIEATGGVAKLTAAQMDVFGAKSQAAIDILTKRGIEIPPILQKVADEAKAAGKSFEESLGKLDIKGAIEDPLGAAEKGVEAFGEALGPAGVAAVGFGLGIVAVIAALGELTIKAAEAGGKLNDVSEVTGIAVPQLSRLSNASSVAGTDLQTMSNAIFMMQKNMGENPDKFQKGLERLNIDFEDFQALSPDQQFLAIAGALKTTEDPVERNAAGFELMGRQFRDLAPSLYKLNEALAATADIQPFTDEEAKQAEAFSMQLASMKVHAEALGLSIGRTLIEPLAKLIGLFASGVSGAANLAGGFGGVASPVGAARVAFSYAQAALEAFGITASDTIKIIDKTAERQENLNKIFDAAHAPDAEVKRWKDAAAGLAVTQETVNQKVREQMAAVIALDIETKKHIELAKDAAKSDANLFGGQTTITAEIETAYQDLTYKVSTYGSTLDQVTASARDYLHNHRDDVQAAADAMGNLDSTSIAYNKTQLELANGAAKLYTAFSTLPNVVSSIGKEIDTSFGDHASGVLGGMVKILHQVHNTFADVAATAAQGAKTMIDSWKDTHSVFDLVVNAATTAIGLISKLFTNAEKQVNPVRQAFVDLNGGLAALNEKAAAAGATLIAMLNAKNPEQYKKAIDDLNAALDFQTGAMKTLDDTVAKYGFTISELGPTFAKQKLDEQAGQLLQDYQVLTAAGVDHVAIINKMGPALNDYVKQSILAGTAIPWSMKPVLQSMVDLGELTDENGNKLTDLSNLTFSDTLDKKFSTLIDTINKLTDAISRGLGTAIQNIPQPGAIHVPVVFDYPERDQPALAAHGGLVTTSGVQYLAGGGRVLSWPTRGSDTVPAMLTPGEGIVSRRGMASLGRAGLSAINSGGGLGGVTVVNHFSIAADVDSPAARERLRAVVDQATMQALRRQKRTNVA